MTKAMKTKTKSLLVRITALSLVLGIAAILFSCFILYTILRARAEEKMEKDLREQILVMAYSLEKHQSIGWLMQYWRQHDAELSLPPFQTMENYEKWLEEHREFARVNLSAVTEEDVQALSDEQQRLFAEYCYFEIFFELAQLRARSRIDVVSCFIPNEGGEGAFACFRSTEEDNILEQHMVLGETWDFRPEEHPMVMTLYEPDSELISGIELSRSPEDGTDYASIYTLIWHNQKPFGVLSLSLSMREITNGIRSDLFGFEKWFVLIILIAILALYLGLYFDLLKPTLRLTRDIRRYTLDRSSEKLSGSLESLVERRDELGILAGDLLEMVEQNEHYFQQRIENESLKTKLLLAQIKPHFIYNCLSVIRSFMDEPQKAEDALNHFALFLRGSVDMVEESECIPALREFKTVDHYLYMQKMRFEDQLCIMTDYRDTGFLLPPFSLQTLVENAIEHGIRGTRDGSGTVWIRSYETDGFHVIEVKDDGAGMPPEGTSEPWESSHVGLKNIEKRLEAMCRGTLTIQSEVGKGSVATIRIPK